MFIQIIEGKTSDAAGFRRFLEERGPEAMKGAIGFLGEMCCLEVLCTVF